MKTMKIRYVLGITLLAVFISGCFMNAAKPQSSSKKARVIIDIPSNVSLDKVRSALKDSIASRSSSFKDNENFMPDELPSQPGKPETKQVIGGGFAAMAAGNPVIEAMNTDTSNAFYAIRGQEKIGSAFNKKDMSYIGAVYPSKNITKVYMLVYYQEASSGITGALVKSMSDAMVGAEGAIPFILQIKEKFLNAMPEAEVVSSDPSSLKDYRLTGMNRVEK